MIEIKKETIQKIAGLLSRKQFSMEEVPALNEVMQELIPHLQEKADDQEAGSVE